MECCHQKILVRLPSLSTIGICDRLKAGKISVGHIYISDLFIGRAYLRDFKDFILTSSAFQLRATIA